MTGYTPEPITIRRLPDVTFTALIANIRDAEGGDHDLFTRMHAHAALGGTVLRYVQQVRLGHTKPDGDFHEISALSPRFIQPPELEVTLRLAGAERAVAFVEPGSLVEVFTRVLSSVVGARPEEMADRLVNALNAYLTVRAFPPDGDQS